MTVLLVSGGSGAVQKKEAADFARGLLVGFSLFKD
jgi:hypothetical protein